MLLSNIEISLSDLKGKKPDVNDYLDADDSNFDDEEQSARKELYREIKAIEKAKSTDLSNEDLVTKLENVKDYETDNLKTILVYKTLKYIAEGNNLFDEAKYWGNKANSIEMDYYIDEDTDDVADDDEERDNEGQVIFSR